VDAVARRVVLDAGEVPHLREHGQALANRLALAARGVERRHELGDVGRGDLVDASRAEVGEDAVELHAMADRGSVGDVDPGCTPALGGLDERRRGGGRLFELAAVGDAHRGELASDPAAAGERLALGHERPRVAVGALAAAEPVLTR
jgi:hypothetical protein